MKTIICFILFCFFLTTKVKSQTLNPKDLIISSYIPDFIIGRKNLGVEYLLPSKKNTNSSSISVLINIGNTSITIFNQKIRGFDLIGELKSYDQLFKSKKWNEYGGVKFRYGNLNNETLKEKKSSYFIGITTGVQPIILKKIALKLNSDIGYMSNGLASMSFFSSNNEIFYSGFTINFNIGLGIRF